MLPCFMKRILIACSTVDGHTLDIGRRLQTQLAGHGHAVDLVRLEDTPPLLLADYDQIVIGASIRYGHFRPALYDFVARHAGLLASKPTAFYAVNAVARKPAKQTAQTNPYTRKFLAKVSWKPPLVGVFGGKINYPQLGPLDRNIIRFIMWMTKGPTDPRSVTDFTDWVQVEAFGERLAGQ